MLPPISEDLPRTGSRGSDAAGDSHSQDQYYHLSYADILYHRSSIFDLPRDSPVRHGMVRPSSSPASDRSWQGAAKTRSTPCLRNLAAQSPWLASISARTHSTSWDTISVVRSSSDRNGRGAKSRRDLPNCRR